MEGPANEQLLKKLASLNFGQLAEVDRYIDFLQQRDAGAPQQPAGPAAHSAPSVLNSLTRPQREPVLNRPREEVAQSTQVSAPRAKSDANKPLDTSPEGVHKAILDIFNQQSATMTSGLLVSTLEGVWKRYGWPEKKLVEGVESLLEKGIFASDRMEPPRFLLTKKGFETLKEQAPTSPPVEKKSRPLQMAEARVTEAHLRSAILGIYEKEKRKRGAVMRGDELQKHWVDVKIRAEHLRTGLEMLEAQGYIRIVTDSGERAFKLTEQGFIYITGLPTPEGFMALAGDTVTEANRPNRYPDLDVLERAAYDLFKMHHADVGSKVTFAIMRLNWKSTGLRDDDLVRGLEGLLKEKMVILEQGQEPAFKLTAEGYKAMNSWNPLASFKKRLTVG